jgi:HPt (histidine-containing phosphotransfer) domain-containing protein
MRRPAPSAADLKLLDPDGSFRGRLEDDRRTIAQLRVSGDSVILKQIVHGLAGAAGTFGYGELGDIAIEIDDAIVKGEAVAVEDIARLLVALEQALGMPRRSA